MKKKNLDHKAVGTSIDSFVKFYPLMFILLPGFLFDKLLSLKFEKSNDLTLLLFFLS